ncbi:RNA-binding domain-containing protein [Xylariaceae sp. FL1019]|nr:RNA-binding domain-containing protein [Xylariaceae sp. FL1019]
MSFPGQPGSNSSLPPRPPPSKVSGFKPAFRPAQTTRPAASPSSYAASSAPGYSSAPANAPQYGAAPPATYQPYGASATPVSAASSYSQQSAYSYPQQAGYQQPSYYGAQPHQQAGAAAAYSGPPQIRNPFPEPSQAAKNDDYDPDMAAQIAQWQSAYSNNPADAAPAAGAPRRPGVAANGATAYSVEAANYASEVANAAALAGDKKKTVARSGGGQKWNDDTLLEWDPSHLRLFVGNLAGETTDESLFKAFSRWKSLQKARVIRDKVTSKSKGFGFVSFSDADEFFQAAKEMNGKYIQSHPVVVRKSTTEIKPQVVKDKHHHGKWNKNKNRNKNNQNRSGNGSGSGNKRDEGYEPHLGPAGGGVTKPGQKTKDGLRLLG